MLLCVLAYVCTYMNLYIFLCIYTSMYTYICVYVFYVCILMYMCVYFLACVYTYMPVWTPSKYLRVQWHTCTKSPTNLQVDSLKLPPFLRG